MIHIDFQGGAHGNYLEFVCNKIAGAVISDALPFNHLGASHKKPYHRQFFFAGHYSYGSEIYPTQFNKIISIQIEENDLLPLQQISLLRAGDYGYNNDHLEIDTFNKLNNVNYRWVLDKLIDGFFTNQIRDSYDAVKDPSWPDVTSLDEFNQLPEHIRTECIQQHGLVLLELSEHNPNCPRSILREFFKISFQYPSQHGFMNRQQKVVYSSESDVYVFPFKCFYSKTEFLNEIKQVADWAGIAYTCENEIDMLHNKFLNQQPYKNSKINCDNVIEQIKSNSMLHDLKMNLLEEAYVNSALGWDYFQ